jgi:hypothetical protein
VKAPSSNPSTAKKERNKERKKETNKERKNETGLKLTLAWG